MKDQVTASTRPRAASVRLARRVRFWIGVSTGFATVASMPRQGLRLDAVDAGDADDLLDEVGLALDVRPPGRRRDLHAVAGAGDAEAELLEDHLGLPAAARRGRTGA